MAERERMLTEFIADNVAIAASLCQPVRPVDADDALFY